MNDYYAMHERAEASMLRAQTFMAISILLMMLSATIAASARPIAAVFFQRQLAGLPTATVQVNYIYPDHTDSVCVRAYLQKPQTETAGPC